MPTNYRFDPYNDALEPLTITNEIYRIPITTPYTLKLTEIPYETSPSSMSIRVADTLSATVTSIAATTITVSNGTWFVPGNAIKIDTEQMYVSAVNGNVLTVTRGQGGTTANLHSIGANVYIENSMTEVSSTPSNGQFYPDYACNVTSDSEWNTGTIMFNSYDAGKRIAINYKGLGTLADDRLIDFKISPNLRMFGNASDGDITSKASFTAAKATYNCRNFTLNAGHTMTAIGPLQIIFCTDTCTIAGAITTVNKGGVAGAGAGYGGGSGGDYGDGNPGTGGNSYINGMLVATDSGSPSSAIIDQYLSFFSFNSLSGAGGGSTSGGRGAGGLIIIAKQIIFTGVINAYGTNGDGYGGGGGGAGVIIGAKTWIANTGAINVAGGTPSGNGNQGGAGWYRKLIID